ncbi:MAG: type VI secretion system-associated FHA domain protein TagH [Gammaproteobacteria bacterium]|nr:type VI secretion system-associated FHA domain protein TagH [Gammaproteobacteria bacterium]
MRLRLNVITYCEEPTTAQLTYCFDQQGGTIGRSADADWTLPDPERYISGKHVAVSFHGDHFMITDQSTNGVYLGIEKRVLGCGNSESIREGDLFQIGDFTIEAALEEVPPGLQESPFVAEPPLPMIDNGIEEHYPLQGNGYQEPFESYEESDYRLSDDMGYAPPQEQNPEQNSESDHIEAHKGHMQPPLSIPDIDFLNDTPEVEEPAPLETPAPITIPRETTSDSSPKVADNAMALKLLLEGAGWNHPDVPVHQADTILRLTGGLFRQLVDGVMRILSARRETKREFRMLQTTIRQRENNPLKFSIGIDDALKHLVLGDSNAYLPPLDAVNEALDDIEAHQLAVMAGMQAALSAMLCRFEPKSLEERFEKQGGRTLLGNKKAWYWEQFADRHQELMSEMEDNFQELFGKEFAKAYEAQIEKLRRMRDN